ncbi:D-alpha,beta-D-heptose 1,7-bisphosphate phosphatase [Ferrimonas sediminum]|uniref:D,D-heptose 1,7-bisphosphate phosphatase n=1 Tax=Ferrimonas sediminum TaxID=718193 RepID=A0A1G8N2X5_9GAMM|nr:D-glycero-beta-D-manno-heptose 1,7-bisphosphate 7-phosphatase [Ferrimonas sediminum]SDI74544.1 D-alpha,beta-D-heptose 1,7-bisphosphate phosphatase [Ferrimonas sediminum]
MRKTVFLDRDGVINVDHGYVHQIDQFEFLPGVLSACRRLHEAGYALVVVTNQSGIARGYYDEAQFAHLTQWMKEQFNAAGAPLTAVYYCPHHPDKGNDPYVRDCDCRKPEPGMLVAAAQAYELDLARSYMIGDKPSDMTAGRQADVSGCVLVRSGKQVESTEGADVVVEGLQQAADWVLKQ